MLMKEGDSETRQPPLSGSGAACPTPPCQSVVHVQERAEAQLEGALWKQPVNDIYKWEPELEESV